MGEIRLDARAKINLTLDVLDRRGDGYHMVEMILQQIELADRVNIKIREECGPIKVDSDNPNIPRGEANIALRAAQLIRNKYGINRAIDIFIEKNIPIAAGLGGGSADAAAVIHGLNRILGLKLSLRAMMELGLSLGADIPFCIMGGAALGRGIGELLTPIKSTARLHVLLVKPPLSISTAWAYGSLDLNNISKRPDNAKVIRALETGDGEGIASGMVNVFETVTAKKYPEILSIKARMLETGALGTVMTGSGPTVIGLFEHRKGAETAAEYFRHLYEEVMITKTFTIKEGE